MNSLLSTAYLAPFSYFAVLQQSKNVLLERFEHYPKQTFRNRCAIYGANGSLSLTVPVTKGDLLKIYTKDLRIDYSFNWVKIHYKAIESAYNSSPFFQFYADEIFDIYHKKYEFLYDFNLELTQCICSFLRIKNNINGTNEYLSSAPEGFTDLRSITNAKNKANSQLSFHFPPYTQVFEAKCGFIENLSIIDLLFNAGPDAGDYLKKVVAI